MQTIMERRNDLLNLASDSPSVASMASIPFFLIMLCTLYLKDDLVAISRDGVGLLLQMLGFTLKTMMSKLEGQNHGGATMTEQVKNMLGVPYIMHAGSKEVLRSLECCISALGYAIYCHNSSLFSGNNDLGLREVKEKMKHYLERCHIQKKLKCKAEDVIETMLKLNWFSVETKRDHDRFFEVIRFHHRNLRDIIVAYSMAMTEFLSELYKKKCQKIIEADMVTMRCFMSILRIKDQGPDDVQDRISFVYETIFQSTSKVDMWYQCQLITDLTCIYQEWWKWNNCPDVGKIVSKLFTQIHMHMQAQGTDSRFEQIDVGKYIMFIKHHIESTEVCKSCTIQMYWKPGVETLSILQHWPTKPQYSFAKAILNTGENVLIFAPKIASQLAAQADEFHLHESTCIRISVEKGSGKTSFLVAMKFATHCLFVYQLVDL